MVLYSFERTSSMFHDLIIVLDTNVVSDIFEASPDYYNFIVQCLEAKKDSIYITDTIFHELSPLKNKPYTPPSFENQKLSFLQQLDTNYKKELVAIDRLKKYERNLSNKDNLYEIECKLQKERDEIKELLDKVEFSALVEPSLSSVTNTNFVKEFIVDLVSNKRISPPLHRSVMQKVSYDVEKSSKEKPFPDKNKKGISKFNDYFIIEELKNLSKELNKGILFVTSDVKGNFQEEKMTDLFKKETSQELVVYSVNEFYSLVAVENNISQENITELFLADEKYEFLEELTYKSELDTLIENYLLGDIEGEDEELEWYNVDLLYIEIDFGLTTDEYATYNITAQIEAEKVFYDYWGRDDDTKAVVTSPANYKTYNGEVVISIIRNFEVKKQRVETRDLKIDIIDTSNLETEINTWGEIEDAMYD